MKIRGLFAQSKTIIKCLVLLLIPLFILCLSTILFYFIATLYGIDLSQINSDRSWMQQMQIFESLTTFVGGAFLCAFLLDEHPLRYLSINKGAFVGTFIIASLCVLLFLPLINALAAANTKIVLPAALHEIEEWMRQMESEAQDMTELLMPQKGFLSYALSIVVMALIPALGEELFFRGALLSFIQSALKNKHASIWITAALFSFIHFQFYGFIPRTLLGGLFGYLLVWSGSIWVPIVAHFINNATAVTAYWLLTRGDTQIDIDQIGVEDFSVVSVVIPTVIAGTLLYLLKKGNGKYPLRADY